MSETTAALGAESTPIGPNLLGFRDFRGAAWATQDTIERLADGEEAEA